MEFLGYYVIDVVYTEMLKEEPMSVCLFLSKSSYFPFLTLLPVNSDHFMSDLMASPRSMKRKDEWRKGGEAVSLIASFPFSLYDILA